MVKAMVKAMVAPLEVAVGNNPMCPLEVAVGNNPMMTGNHRSTPNHRPFGKCHAAGG